MRALITKLFVCLLVCCLYSGMAQAQQSQWGTVGAPSVNNAGHSWVTVHPNGTPYVVHAEGNVVVRRLAGTEWEQVGPTITATASSYVHMVIDRQGTVYVAFGEGSNGGTVRTFRYDAASNTWVALGAGGNILALDGGRHTYLALDNNDNLFLTYRATSGAVSRQARVAKYLKELDQWVDAATGSLTDLPQIGTREVQFNSLAFDKDNTAYLFFQEGHASREWKGTMKKLVAGNTAWETVSTELFTPSYMDFAGIAIGDNGTVYVSFKDGNFLESSLAAISVMKYDATTGWSYVGGGKASVNTSVANNSTGPYAPVVLDKSGMPVIFYRDNLLGGVVRRFDGTNWQTVGSSPVTSHGVTSFSLAIDKNTNTIYTSYRNAANKTEVSRYICGPGITAQPVNSQANEGAAATLSITAVGSNLAYQWQVDRGNGFENLTDNTTYSGATTGTLSIAATTVQMNRNRYRVMLTADCGTATSAEVSLAVLPAPATWITAGGAPASDGGGVWSTVDVSSTGIPYVLYNEGGYRVRRLVNGAWEPVGGAITATANNNTANYPYIRLDNNDVPYIAYQDADNGTRLTVQRFNGTAWEVVGTAGFTTGAIRWAFINFDNNNVPYVAHRDIGVNRGRMVRFVNGTWEYLPDFHPGIAENPTTAFDKNNVLHIAYRDGTTAGAYRLTVKRFNGATNTWEALGAEAFNAGGHTTSVGNPYLALDNNDVPYVTFHDGSATAGLNKMVVMRYSSGTWTTVGTNAAGTSPGFSVGTGNVNTGTTYLGFTPDNRPVVHFPDGGQSGRGVFMILNNNIWSMVGGEPGSTNSVTQSGGVMDSKTGTMYFSYRNTGDGGKIYVRSFAAGPYIVASPTDREVNEGDNLTLTGTAAGANLTYQWQVNPGTGRFENLVDGPVYSGTSTTTLTIGFADASTTNYQYRMVAGTQYGASATNAATLVVIPSNICYPPEITAQPVAATTICQDLNTSFTVAATGSEVGFKWQVSTDGTTFTDIENNGIYSGANEATLVITGATPAMNGNVYQVVLTGACAPALVSERTVLTVNQNPVVAAEPVNASASCIGSNVNFVVGATGTGVVYRWQVDAGSGFADISNGDQYSGAASNTLTVVGATTAMNSNRYRVILSGTCAQTDTSSVVQLNVYQPFVAGRVQPGAGICYNTVPAAITSTAVASGGNNNFTYTWERSADGTTWQPIAGATESSYTPTAPLTQSTYYRRAAHNATCGTTFFTEPVMVTVYGDMNPGQVNGTQTLTYGTMPAMLGSAADATGGNGVTYQWEMSENGTTFTAIPNATGRSFTPPAAAERTTTYRRVATSVNGCGTVISNTVTITVEQKVLALNEVPNVLLPNGNDEQNRRWGVSHLGLSGTVRIRVFDQKGQTVFETDNAQTEWNGQYKGRMVPEGAYFFSIEHVGGNRVSGSIKVIY